MIHEHAPVNAASLVRRRALLTGAAALCLGSGARAVDTLRVGVPRDVADDFLRFINTRDVAALARFDGPGSRRDVMELAWLLREIKRQPQAPDVQLVRIDSYERLMAEVRDGHVDVIGTSAWLADLEMLGSGNITISAAMIRKGDFVVGVYTSPRNDAALLTRTLSQLRVLRFTCNSDWSLDWSTLRNLGILPQFDVKTWGQMVALIDSGRADALMAPFQPTSNAMELRFEGKTLVPIEGIGIALLGSRHLACSKRTAQGKWVAANVFPPLAAQARSGALRKAYEECGFYNPRTRNWTIF
jgi:ABC-type amino acid transport substrate-binding protein